MAGTAMEQRALTVDRGCLIAFRTFDACDSVSLPEAEQLLLSARVARESLQFRAPLGREISALRQSAVPLCIELGAREIAGSGEARVYAASARVYDYGT